VILWTKTKDWLKRHPWAYLLPILPLALVWAFWRWLRTPRPGRGTVYRSPAVSDPARARKEVLADRDRRVTTIHAEAERLRVKARKKFGGNVP